MEAPLSRSRAHALLHVTVLLWGATAVLGKSIQLPALPLVFYRVAIVTGLMVVVLVRRQIAFAVPWRRAFELGAVGTLVAIHWVLFYGAVKVAGVAVAVLCISTVTFFTALLEPLAFRRRVRRQEIIVGALVVFGVLLILRLETHGTVKGYAMGIGSAFFAASFGAWNGRIALRERSERMTFYELAAAAVTCGFAFALLGGFVPPWDVSHSDWVLLIFLAVACTLLPWLWSLRVLKTLSPYTVAISVSLEPVYSILFAFLFLPNEEHLTVRFYLGGGFLIALIIFDGVRKARRAVGA